MCCHWLATKKRIWNAQVIYSLAVCIIITFCLALVELLNEMHVIQKNFSFPVFSFVLGFPVVLPENLTIFSLTSGFSQSCYRFQNKEVLFDKNSNFTLARLLCYLIRIMWEKYPSLTVMKYGNERKKYIIWRFGEKVWSFREPKKRKRKTHLIFCSSLWLLKQIENPKARDHRRHNSHKTQIMMRKVAKVTWILWASGKTYKSNRLRL